MIAGAASVGVRVLSATPSELNARLQSSTAEYLVHRAMGSRRRRPASEGRRIPRSLPGRRRRVRGLGHRTRPSRSSDRSSRRSDCGATTTSAPSSSRASRRSGRSAASATRPARPGARPRPAGARRGRTIALVPEVLATEDLAPGDFAGTAAAQTGRRLPPRGARHPSATVEEVEPFVRRVRYEIVGDAARVHRHPDPRRRAEIAGTDRVLVVEAIRGIVERSTYQNIEFVVVADGRRPTTSSSRSRSCAGIGCASCCGMPRSTSAPR